MQRKIEAPLTTVCNWIRMLATICIGPVKAEKNLFRPSASKATDQTSDK